MPRIRRASRCHAPVAGPHPLRGWEIFSRRGCRSGPRLREKQQLGELGPRARFPPSSRQERHRRLRLPGQASPAPCWSWSAPPAIGSPSPATSAIPTLPASSFATTASASFSRHDPHRLRQRGERPRRAARNLHAEATRGQASPREPRLPPSSAPSPPSTLPSGAIRSTGRYASVRNFTDMARATLGRGLIHGRGSRSVSSNPVIAGARRDQAAHAASTPPPRGLPRSRVPGRAPSRAQAASFRARRWRKRGRRLQESCDLVMGSRSASTTSPSDASASKYAEIGRCWLSNVIVSSSRVTVSV